MLDAGSVLGAADAARDADASPAAPYPIEARFATSGPWAVASCQVPSASMPCRTSTTLSSSATEALYDVVYPSDPDASARSHPILTWGNGTDAAPAQYSVLLKHLASWGFVVIASTSPNTGTGAEMIAGVDYLVAENEDSTSPFYDKLDTTRIGALGHSQGADGAAQATLAANAAGSTHRPIRALLPIELPSQQWTCFGSTDAACAARESFDSSRLASTMVFFVDGSKDTLIAPATQSATTSGEQSIEAYYENASTPKAKATLIGADHNDVQDSCVRGLGCAGVGPRGYLGYAAAWFMYTLAGDSAARLAFAGPSPEILREKTNWQDQATEGLP